MKTWAVLGMVGVASSCVAGSGREGPLQEEGAGSRITFEVRETDRISTVIGRDAEGREVGRLELVHGALRLSDYFVQEGQPRDVVGRKLDVNVGGQVLAWETEGFDPTMSLPAHPPGHERLAAFLEDEHVKPLLARWGIAFASGGLPPGGLDDPTFILNGTHPCQCTGTTCPTITGSTPGVCSGGTPSDFAFVVHQRAAPGYLAPRTRGDVVFDQSFVVQCCPAVPAAPAPFLGRKSCPDTSTRPAKSSCGKAIATCTGCPLYDTQGICSIEVQPAGSSDVDAPLLVDAYCGRTWTEDEQRAMHNVIAHFCGDGICDAGAEDCSTCASDCECDD